MNKQWRRLLNDSQIKLLNELLLKAYSDSNVYPPKEKVFSAFEFFNPSECKVIILGQDPYHGKNQANGLAFSVDTNQKIPPSLRNIFKELNDDIGVEMPQNGDLSSWAKQDVLLMNAVFTVKANQAGSHGQLGWQNISKQILYELAKVGGKVFILLGAWAQTFAKEIDAKNNHIITTAHPSPLSAYRGFFGSKIFSECNTALIKMGKKPIAWQLQTNTQYELFK